MVNIMNYDYALFCRGFVFSDMEINSPKEDWKQFILKYNNKNYYLWYDSKNELSFKTKGNNFCLILGYAMDTVDWHMEIDIICDSLLSNLCKSLNCFYDYLDVLNGRFVIIFGYDNNIIALNDATAMRSVYYHDKKCIIASHYEIIKNLTNETKHPFYDTFINIEKYKPWTLPGDMTPYNNIKILLANHELDLITLKIRRFFPRENNKEISLDEALLILPNHLKNQMETLVKYATPLISMTSGRDSKLTLSTTRDIKDKCIYFTFVNENPNLSNYDQRNRLKDFSYSKHISKVYNLNFKPLILNGQIFNNNELSKILKINHYHQHIPSAILEYIEKLPKGIHVQSNLIEIIRDLTYVYPKPPKHNSPQEIMSGWMMYWSIRHEIKDIINDFWKRNQWDEIFDYERVRLFYWEHRMSAWNNAATLLENDCAFNTYMLLNCRKLLNLGFCIPKYDRDKDLLVKYSTEKLWPELLYYIENTNKTLFDYYEYNTNAQKLELKDNLRYNTNLENKILKIEKNYQVIFGFDKCNLKSNDFCEIKLNKTLLIKKYVQISLTNDSNSLLTENNALYYIKTNSNLIYEQDLSTLINKSNIINIELDLDNFEELSIGIFCLKPINLNDYGIYLNLNLEYIKISDKPFQSIINLIAK